MRATSLLGFLTVLCALAGTLAGCANGTDQVRPDGGAADVGPRCTDDDDCEDDGVFCNGTPSCVAGACVEGRAPSCDDGLGCTTDTCVEAARECQSAPSDARCPDGSMCVLGTGCVVRPACEFDDDCVDDGLFCNGAAVCVDAMCVSPSGGPCADTNSCTLDECVEASDTCTNTPADHLTDALHCGRTGANDCVVCPSPTAAQVNTVASCVAGACGLVCAPGFGNPDGDLANGCECGSGVGTDEPDARFEDTNCDGLDGDRARAILVSVSMGNDNATCGLALDRPCRTIAHATTRAITESRRDLFLMAGTYDEVVVLRDGIRLFGGYDTAWVRGARVGSAHRTVIRGALDMTEGQYLTVRAHDLVVAPTLENLILVGPTPPAASGLSSYVIHVESSAGLQVIRCTLQQGDGASGVIGTSGVDATSVVATVSMGGVAGGAADYYVSPCDPTSAGAGGAAGTNVCTGTSTLAVTAGRGGSGGTMDSACLFVCDGAECVARAGSAGTAAAQVLAGSYGAAGSGGAGATTCGAGLAGLGGRVQNGAAGAGAASSRGRVAGGYFVGNTGGTGGAGENGGGGGGGGGSGGCDTNVTIFGGDNSHGAGGGGGGAGGCAARGGGLGGGGGGGSFGVFAVSASVSLDDCELQRAQGGVGGAGGAGGRGQSGGPGGAGGAMAGSARAGGLGGTGGHGGHGGGGGGGAGGPSIGVFGLDATITSSGLLYTAGSAGAAGPGGVSAPSAVGVEDDGNDGTAGPAGVLAESFVCAAATGC